MIQRLSDEQKYDLVRDFEKTLINAGATEIAHATSDFLFGINTADRFYIPQLEKMQEEIATLRSLIDAQKEIATLTAKHERLVKVASTHIAFPTSRSRQELKNLLTEQRESK